ncbi:Receptor-Transporting Protein 5 [Manis pentadactyla]|nr:Receptor-Transporting Protein 5 [Manis pentadactyla]
MTRHATAPPGNERSTSAQALRLRRCAGDPAAVPRGLCPLLPGVPGGINAERDVAATTTRRSGVTTQMAEVIQPQECWTVLEENQSIPKALPGSKDVTLMSASSRHHNSQRVQKLKNNLS